jgi:hypothetical protein
VCSANCQATRQANASNVISTAVGCTAAAEQVAALNSIAAAPLHRHTASHPHLIYVIVHNGSGCASSLSIPHLHSTHSTPQSAI